ncbi:hypothetical protein M422DRAFT_70169 [Sphaerobolus stellatus SS14]|uniref:t-SNARE coiled-coil homology domain-containing protein n=1 Tax=Sphaerobolus stellatus (strain SS14) TaxID=990650 RepID=A0A0C9TWC6_SPHS4|nr:hypothetical protein M422DRAFT_70169 [Sphaerobolus stellatus SS14]
MARDRLTSLRDQQQGFTSGERWSYPSRTTDKRGDISPPPVAYIQLDRHSYYDETELSRYPNFLSKAHSSGNLKDFPDPFGRGIYDVKRTRTGSNATLIGTRTSFFKDDMTEFYAEISSIQDSLKTFNDKVSRISDLHARSLNSMDWATARRSVNQAEYLMKETEKLADELKGRIKELYRVPAKGREGDIRKQQSGMVKYKFIEAIQSYQKVEQTYRTKYKQRLEKQFLIVNPEATPDEVKEVVEGEHGDQIFSKILQTSTRHGEARAAFREVRDRHDDIKKIEQTITKLSELFNEMDILVMRDGEKLEGIHTMAMDVESQANEGLTQASKAVEHARSRRRKRWMCIGIAVVLLILFIVAVTILSVLLASGNNIL